MPEKLLLNKVQNKIVNCQQAMYLHIETKLYVWEEYFKHNF